jgi:hypothetical protein
MGVKRAKRAVVPLFDPSIPQRHDGFDSKKSLKNKLQTALFLMIP